MIVAPREGFEPPRPMDSGFQIHRNTGLCDLGNMPASYPLEMNLYVRGYSNPVYTILVNQWLLQGVLNQ